MPDDSMRTVLVALGAGIGVTLAKVGAAVFTGSTALAAEAGAWTGAAGGPRGHDVAGVTQPLRPAEEERVRAFVLGYPGVTAIRELLFTFVGPGRIWIVARIDIDDGLRGAQVKSLVHGIESGLKHESDNVYRADIVPTGSAQAVIPT